MRKRVSKRQQRAGARCCKCNGGRGAYGTKCYDNPEFCCGAKKMKKSKNRNNNKPTKKGTLKSFVTFLKRKKSLKNIKK